MAKVLTRRSKLVARPLRPLRLDEPFYQVNFAHRATHEPAALMHKPLRLKKYFGHFNQVTPS